MSVMYKTAALNMPFIVCVIICIYAIIITVELILSDLSCKNLCSKTCTEIQRKMQIPPWKQYLDFNGFNNESGTADGHYIVPNYVHFIQFGSPKISFIRAVCILSAFKRQKPDKIFIHTNLARFYGRYWDVVLNTPGLKKVLFINKVDIPTEIFGQRIGLSYKYYHAADVTRLQILMKYGGIYLDTDSYVVRNLNDLRRYEMTVGWQPGRNMGDQILIAHKNARFLRLWYDSYKNNYDSDSMVYNTGKYPTERILNPQPYLVHRVEKLLGVYDVKRKIYKTEFPEWYDFYTLHLFNRRLDVDLESINETLKYPVEFNEKNILRYPVAIREMCKAVYPFSST